MVTYAKISPKSGEPQRYSWGTHKKKRKKVDLLVPDHLVTPGTESLTRHIDLLDEVTHTHLRVDSQILPNTNQFLLSLSAISRTSIVFHGCVDFRQKRFPAFRKYDAKGWDLWPGGGQPFGSSLSKRLSSICKFAEHCWCTHTKWPPIRLQSLNGWLASDDWVTSLRCRLG